MTGETATRRVVQRPGLGLLDAAAWVGSACWAELRWHEVLTAWLRAEADPSAATRWWRLRADAAERAEAWHRRLPELRELPRSDFVRPPSAVVLEALDRAAQADAEDRPARATAVLDNFIGHYQAHSAVAVGCADGPAARTLADALTALRGTAVE